MSLSLSLSLVSTVCCQVEASASADHSSRGVLPSVVCVTERDHESSDNEEASVHWHCCAMVKRKRIS
jgi:hypothetical protein